MPRAPRLLVVVRRLLDVSTSISKGLESTAFRLITTVSASIIACNDKLRSNVGGNGLADFLTDEIVKVEMDAQVDATTSVFDPRFAKRIERTSRIIKVQSIGFL